MIELESGKTCLYQWNTEQRIITDYPAGTVFDFTQANTVLLERTAYALGSKVVCNIPNAILQLSGTLYIYVQRIEGGQLTTVLEKTYPVKAQPKPRSYVNDEQEIEIWKTLEDRIAALEAASGTGAKIYACTTPADENAKAVDTAGLNLHPGGRLSVRFVHGSTAKTPTLDAGGRTGTIWANPAPDQAGMQLPPNYVAELTAMETGWLLMNPPTKDGADTCGKWIEDDLTCASAPEAETKIVTTSDGSAPTITDHEVRLIRFADGSTADRVTLQVGDASYEMARNPWRYSDRQADCPVGEIPVGHTCLVHFDGQYAYWQDCGFRPLVSFAEEQFGWDMMQLLAGVRQETVLSSEQVPLAEEIEDLISQAGGVYIYFTTYRTIVKLSGFAAGETYFRFAAVDQGREFAFNYDRSSQTVAAYMTQYAEHGDLPAYAVCHDPAAPPSSTANSWYIPKSQPRPSGNVGMMLDVYWEHGRVNGLGYNASLIWGAPDGPDNETIVSGASITDTLTGTRSIPAEGTVRYQLEEANGRKHWRYVSGDLIPTEFSTATDAATADKLVHGLALGYLPGMEIYVQMDAGNSADLMRLVPDEGETLPVYGNGTGAHTGAIPAGYILHLKNAGDHWQIINSASTPGSGDIAIIEYNSTTFDEVLALHKAGKTIICRDAVTDAHNTFYATLTHIWSQFTDPDAFMFGSATTTGDNAFVVKMQIHRLSGWRRFQANVTGGPGGGGLYIATYGETTFEEILEQYNAGKTIFCRDPVTLYDQWLYPAGFNYATPDGVKTPTNFIFSGVGAYNGSTPSKMETVYCSQKSGWKKTALDVPDATLYWCDDTSTYEQIKEAFDAKRLPIMRKGRTYAMLYVIDNTHAQFRFHSLPRVKILDIKPGEPVAEYNENVLTDQVQNLTPTQQKQMRDNIGVTEGGGALQKLTFTGASTAEYDGTQPVTVEIPQGGSGGDIGLGVTGASIGQIIEVEEVDESGKPKKWKAVEKPSGGGEKPWQSKSVTLPDAITEFSEVLPGKPHDVWALIAADGTKIIPGLALPNGSAFSLIPVSAAMDASYSLKMNAVIHPDMEWAKWFRAEGTVATKGGQYYRQVTEVELVIKPDSGTIPAQSKIIVFWR